jgi:hypothetical protein
VARAAAGEAIAPLGPTEYQTTVSTTDNVVETLRDWLSSTNPGQVTREDLARVETKLDELMELVDEIEERLSASND